VKPIKMPTAFFMEHDKPIPNLQENKQWTTISKILKKNRELSYQVLKYVRKTDGFAHKI
jgi:c-di-GMP-related signal transduction protein